MKADGFTTYRLPRAAPARVLACGAWLKNSACLLDGDTVHCSPVHGDLGDPDHRAALLQTVARLREMAHGPIAALAHDLHPDFYSTQVAQRCAYEWGVPAIAVQHHHAHLALVQAEYGVTTPIVGLALDGVGLGEDGHAWGGEVLALDGARCTRVAHLPELALPGGDVAAREPWRMAAAALHRVGRLAQFDEWDGAWGDGAQVSPAARRTVRALLERQLNCPITTSAGRWFDAAAGLLGVSAVQGEEAQAAIALEQLAAQHLQGQPVPVQACTLADPMALLDPLIEELWSLRLGGGGPDRMAHGAARFHVVLAQVLAEAAVRAARPRGVQRVALGGGCLFNRVLSARLAQHLEQAGLQVLRPGQFSPGDAGLALGQAWAASLQLSNGATVSNMEGNAACV